jgi:endo-1,3-1,4-beta-glycanase ExoK
MPKNSIVVCIISGFLCSCLSHSNIESKSNSTVTAYPGYTGNYAGFSLKLDERFDHFNAAIWQKGDGAVGSESACRFQDQGVQLKDGLLELVIQQESIASSWSDNHQANKPSYAYSCGELRTRNDKKIRYGRIEVRMKAPSRQLASGYISSVFTYTFGGTPAEWEEIDIELEGGRPDKLQANLIYGLEQTNWWGTRSWGAWEDKITIGPVDEWHVYAIEWLPDEIKWFVDGTLIKSLNQTSIDCSQGCKAPQIKPTPIPDNFTNIMMNFWIPNDDIQDNFGGNKRDNTYPMKSQYDWIRYYQLDSHPADNW